MLDRIRSLFDMSWGSLLFILAILLLLGVLIMGYRTAVATIWRTYTPEQKEKAKRVLTQISLPFVFAIVDSLFTHSSLPGIIASFFVGAFVSWLWSEEAKRRARLGRPMTGIFRSASSVVRKVVIILSVVVLVFLLELSFSDVFLVLLFVLPALIIWRWDARRTKNRS